MSNLERFSLAALGILVVVASAIVVIGPLQNSRPGEEDSSIQNGRETLPALVIDVLAEGSVDLGAGSTHPYQELLLRIEGGSLAGQEIAVAEGTVNIIGKDRLFDPGDRVYLERVPGPDGDRFYISDFIRTWPLFWITGLFLTLVALVGRGRGLRSLGGTLFSLVMIFVFVLPQIMAGRDPVGISIFGAIILLSVSTFLVYGWNPKAYAAVVGMMFSLVLTGILAWLFVKWARLTGMGMEESAYLVMELGSGINLRGLVLGGIIIGSLGVLDDICIGQASAVFELANLNRDLGWKALFRSSLNIGRDHIAAMVNTLMLAYVGASMPLMLVFSIYQEPIWRRINREPIAEEIVRTMVGSIGLVLAVPITGLVASLIARWVIRREKGRLGAS